MAAFCLSLLCGATDLNFVVPSAADDCRAWFRHVCYLSSSVLRLPLSVFTLRFHNEIRETHCNPRLCTHKVDHCACLVNSFWVFRELDDLTQQSCSCAGAGTSSCLAACPVFKLTAFDTSSSSRSQIGLRRQKHTRPDISGLSAYSRQRDTRFVTGVWYRDHTQVDGPDTLFAAATKPASRSWAATASRLSVSASDAYKDSCRTTGHAAKREKEIISQEETEKVVRGI